MKQANQAVQIALIVAVIVLYILFFTSRNPSKPTPSKDKTESTATNIAYFNTDSVNAQVDYIKRNSAAQEKKQKNMDAELKRLQTNLQKRMQKFNKKLQEGGYSQVTGEAESKAIAKQQEAIEKKNAEYMKQILKEQEAMSKKLNDALLDVLKNINNNEKYDYIFSYQEGGIMFMPNEKLDITDQVVKDLNAILK